MPDRIVRLLDDPRVPWWAASASVAIGLFFVFIWAPHPWGWLGIDQYHNLARALARGEPFATTDVPWGYAYFVAAHYALFGEHGWIPLTTQVLANATVPVMLYHLVRPLAGIRIAALAAMLTGVFSFNTVYASTQSSDAVCTVLFVASLLMFARGARTGQLRDFAISGLLSGLVPQFRPNMILFPVVLAAAFLLLQRRRWRHAAPQMLAFLTLVALALAPWTIRNFRLTGQFLPTSTHGGIQLWYGSLQVGPYLDSFAYNPRNVFAAAPFDYSSLAGQPIVVSGERQRCAIPDSRVSLIYWTDRERRRHTLRPDSIIGERVVFTLPSQPSPTAIFYYFESGSLRAGGVQATPPEGAQSPWLFFVSDDHLGDLDRGNDLLDVFDLVRAMRERADDGGRSTQRASASAASDDELKSLVVRLLGDGATLDVVSSSPLLGVDDNGVTLRLADGSSLTVPPTFSGRVTDITVQGTLARALVSARRRVHESPDAAKAADPCATLYSVRVNDVFYRREPHEMRRYTALAFDNIWRDPVAFLAAATYRMGRLFVISGGADEWTTQQFRGSGVVYAVAGLLSMLYLIFFLAGVIIAWRQGRRLLPLLIPIVYVPVTICFVLTNMRYTVTVQPLMFAFVAAAAEVLLVRALPPSEARSRE